jgi:cell wall-associated NlpC family hydrolase
MSGSDVLALQHDLTALGFSTAATGHFTRQTQSRLVAFQRKYGLRVDGVAGSASIVKLKKLLSASLHITDGSATMTSDSRALPVGDSGTGGVGLGPQASGSPAQGATLIGGLVVPAPGTPSAVVAMIDAANRIAFDPYIYGGGHASFIARGYDCSGSVSYALHAASLLATPLDSEQFLGYGLPGKGNWITIYTNGPTHVYMEIAGLWFDTAAQSALNGMDRWSATRIAEPGYGNFRPRHPAGW